MGGLPREWLVGPTTFHEYCRRWFGDPAEMPPKLQARVEQRAAEVAAKLSPEDELWEWHADGGPFSSAGGMAVLRGGKIVEWWREWVS